MKAHPDHSNLLLFDIFEKESNVIHFSTTRVGGVSGGTYASWNMGNFSDDDPVNINRNRNMLAQMFFMNLSNFVIPHQTHSDKVVKIDDAFLRQDQSELINALYGVDATVTNQKEIFLCVTTADCVPVLLYDRKNKVIAAIHAGWRGTVSRIVEKTIDLMVREFGSSPDDMLAAIGPAIRMENYEVGEEVVSEFEENGFNLTDVSIKEFGKIKIDLKEINRQELIRLGISEKQIEKSDLCTFDNADLFFSARRQTIHSGRMLTGIMMQ